MLLLNIHYKKKLSNFKLSHQPSVVRKAVCSLALFTLPFNIASRRLAFRLPKGRGTVLRVSFSKKLNKNSISIHQTNTHSLRLTAFFASFKCRSNVVRVCVCVQFILQYFQTFEPVKEKQNRWPQQTTLYFQKLQPTLVVLLRPFVVPFDSVRSFDREKRQQIVPTPTGGRQKSNDPQTTSLTFNHVQNTNEYFCVIFLTR